MMNSFVKYGVQIRSFCPIDDWAPRPLNECIAFTLSANFLDHLTLPCYTMAGAIDQ
jgi:hypothetical protein